MVKKRLNAIVACKDCMVECVETEKGVLCPKCGAYINESEMEF